jgi:2-keto-3-deoxy-L-rhamnonate aldolase RhmA
MSTLRHRIAQGELVIGQLVWELFTPGAVYAAANCGLDFVLFDMEHGRCDLALLDSLIHAARAAAIPPLVRAPDAEFVPLARLLDMGAEGIMVPRIETGAQMRDVVARLKYAPQGRRGVALGVAHDRYGARDTNYFPEANDRTVVIALLETAAAFENLEEIVSTPGVDVAWMGHYDLTVSMGIPAQFDHPRFLEAMDRLVETCRRHSVAPGFLPANPDDGNHWISKGFRMISLGTDIGTYQAALRRFHEGIRPVKA